MLRTLYFSILASVLATFATSFVTSAKYGRVSLTKLSITNRRDAIDTFMGTVAATFIASPAVKILPVQALDMDAFINSEISNDTKNCDPKRDPKCIPKLSQDEALCKYGQSGDARQEACRRVKAAGIDVPKANAQGKNLGGAYAM